MKKYIPYMLVALFISVLIGVFGHSAIQTISGLAVAQTSTVWNNLRDAAAGDDLTKGVGASGIYIYDGTNFDRVRGTGGSINVTASVLSSGNAFYAIKKTNLSTSSFNFAFGFTSKKIAIESPSSNTDDICIDWLGGTAVCPAVDTAGDDRIAPGASIILDDYSVTSISAIAASGTQTLTVKGWN